MNIKSGEIRKTYLILLFILSLSNASIASEYDIPGYTFIGEIPVDCKQVINPISSIQTPKGFKISPNQAMKIAINNSRIKCVSKLQQVIYADKENYYFFNSIVLASDTNFIKYSVVVDGKTGSIKDNMIVH